MLPVLDPRPTVPVPPPRPLAELCREAAERLAGPDSTDERAALLPVAELLAGWRVEEGL